MKALKRFILFAGLYLAGALMIAAALFFDPQIGLEKVMWVENIIVFASAAFLFKYMAYMVMAPWYDALWQIKKHKSAKEISAYKPLVSVLVPAWNEEVGLLKTVESILGNKYENVEVVVVNDGSTDDSDNVMKSFVSEYGTRPEPKKSLVYSYQENAGKAAALNKGIELSKGEIIMTIDADSILHEDAIENFVARFADPSVMGAVGNVKIGNADSFVGIAQYLEFLFSFYFKRADSLIGSIYIIGGAAGAFRRSVFDVIGKYSHMNITEDIELTVRMQKSGMKIVYASDAVVYTEGASDIKSLLKQRLRWKRGRIDTFLEHKNLFFSLRKGHNKFLSWFVLPFAVFGDTQLMFEVPFIIFLYAYALVTDDIAAFVVSMIIVGFVFLIQAFTDERKRTDGSALFLIPVSWLMFYMITLIEINALIRSLWEIFKGGRPEWQKWDRRGISIENKKEKV